MILCAWCGENRVTSTRGVCDECGEALDILSAALVVLPIEAVLKSPDGPQEAAS